MTQHEAEGFVDRNTGQLRNVYDRWLYEEIGGLKATVSRAALDAASALASAQKAERRADRVDDLLTEVREQVATVAADVGEMKDAIARLISRMDAEEGRPRGLFTLDGGAAKMIGLLIGGALLAVAAKLGLNGSLIP